MEKLHHKRDADELFKEFKETSITEFFRKNRAHLGYSGKLRSLTTVIHEIVTNSLDACEEAGILPEIYVEINSLGNEHYRVFASDNGPGIPIRHISDVFGKMLAGTKFHRNIQLRGQQGIGVAGVTMFSQITTGKPIKIRTSTGNGKVYEVKLMIDIAKNRADIISKNEYEQYWRGTEIEVELKNVKFNLSDKGPFEYIRRTAIANPHARITFVDPEGRKTVFERSSDKIPKPPIAIKPHPKGIEVDDLLQMAKASNARKVSSFLTSTFARMSNAKVKEIQEYVSFDLNKNPRRLTWSECEEIVNAIRNIKFLAPSTEGLEPIGEKQIRSAVLNILDPEFESVLTRPPRVHSGGTPFIIEAAIAYGGHAGRNSKEGVRAEVMRFANRAPLLFDAGGCAITKAINSIDWKRYGLKDIENSPITIFVNIVSTYVPYTSAGKQSIAEEKEILKEIRMALMDLGRKFQVYHSRKRRAMEREAKRQILMKYSTELAAGLAKLTGEDENKILRDLQELIEEKIRTGVILEEGEKEGEIEMEVIPEETEGEEELELEEVV
ncbi:MAG: DNA topoisomerase VI subunit B [Candidatus Altiarchaeales archaeon]|nr:MAG: DNA topoisomerase VI subunit B [Candidatus Altiarchaeales archaeon]RLI94638.1 MAG: DNA topoisomerase VI subunit B [Candidatus Altiarchaeales archaeon]HDO82049.1 DNA topoisomerase VI subunit B [Candidatus Altiarchaeales archaeon]HEX54698.1 DNA topoisomerase VI subunit B [Candidatus Altiarchaeales archaeon]